MIEVAEKSLKYSVLQGFVPLDALSNAHLQDLADKAVIEEFTSDEYVFRGGVRDDQTIYLLEGVVELINADGQSVAKLTGQSKAARHPLAHAQPRQLSVRVIEKATVVKIDTTRLDALLSWSESTGYNVEELSADNNDDWLTRLLQSETFSRLSPVNIQQLLSSMESVPASAGDIIVEEGSVGEFFYVVKQGRLSVTRKGAVEDKDVLLAELSEGACFGEEALVAGTQRNATVTMLTDGILMRVSKQDFDELLRAPLVQTIDYELASQAVQQGAVWLDVRLADEYRNVSLPASLNLPLSELRDRLDELDHHSQYITCCDTGRRSASAAFVLSQHGFDATALEKGLMEVPWDDLDEAVPEETQVTEASEEVSDNAVDEKLTAETAPVSVAESAAHAAVINDYQTKLDETTAENSRLASELESVRLELRHQTDEMVRVIQESKENASSLAAAREALIRTQNEQQDTLNQQTRLTHRLSTLENENNQLRRDYEIALKQSTGSSADIEAQAGLEQNLTEARQQLEQLTAEIKQLNTSHKLVVKDRDTRIKSLEIALESERAEVQQQIDEITAGAEADARRQLSEVQASLATQNDSGEKAGEEISELQAQLEQLTRERDASEAAARQASQEADQMRAELEVSRGLEAMQPATTESELQENITQLKTELDAETAQRVRAETEVERWKNAAEGLEKTIQEAREEDIVATPVMYTSPADEELVDALSTSRPEQPGSEPEKRVIASKLLEDDDLESGPGFGFKWKLVLGIGAIVGVAVLYWLPDLGKQTTAPLESTSAPERAEQPKVNGTAAVNTSDAAAVESPGKAVEKPGPDPVSVEKENVTETVAETVAAIEAMEATSRSPVDIPAIEEPVSAQKPVIKMKPGKLFSDRLSDGSRGPRMVQIPAGSFSMGSTVASPNFNERPQHQVELSAFAIGKYEITFAEYDRFAQATNRELPADAGWGRGRQPVINISWDDAVAYVNWLSAQTGFNYRLPTEAEWEYAARAGTVTHFWWGNEPDADGKANCFDCGSRWDGAKPAAAGSFPANAVGVHEIAGNVMEWVQDCYLPDYQVASTVGAAAKLTPCDAHVVRGGSYSSPLDTLRSAARSRRVPQARIDNLGFRVVRAN